MTDPVADMLTRIMNAVRVKHQEVVVPHSKLKESILEIFKDQGYIKNYRVISENNKKDIVIYLKYTEEGESVIRGAEKVSKPGRRIYVKSKNLDIVLGGLGTGVVSTSSGIKTVKQCKKEKVGGEYLCKIW
ncbi:30S ribosomal protein S8 [Calditerrivibrio nitroreducens]|uniref:Small ribosomal subunit protein uS8 n=1 Tax=Calditerrivibrio nitroreducens (strain DSM 19672 / NBRC 101217 / Yu37-1) TaxID=768670 RepID=E4TEP4_CALNY|nr:30S ribosomal protein S8 [Calditerrivibrio nitroreducens]ADR19401.1 SSU ribosomal protein S8P [Calditerrivibrio nitroreducens DSM 19672]